MALTLLPCIKAQKGQKFRFDFKNPPPCAHALGKCRPEWKNKKKTSAKGKIKVEEEGEGMLSQLEGNFRLPNNPPNIFLVRPTHKRSEPLTAVGAKEAFKRRGNIEFHSISEFSELTNASNIHRKAIKGPIRGITSRPGPERGVTAKLFPLRSLPVVLSQRRLAWGGGRRRERQRRMRESKRASKEAKGEWKIHSYYAQHPTQRKENLKDFDIGRHVYAPESRRQRRFDSLEVFAGSGNVQRKAV